MGKLMGMCLLATALYMPMAEAQSTLKTEEIIGIGITIEKLVNGAAQVNAVIPGAPAEQAGIAIGDLIHQVRSQPTGVVVDVRALSLPDIVALIRGPISVPVEIYFTRGSSELKMLSIVRQKFEVESAE